MKNIPDQRQDDIFFAKLFSEWGEQEAMSLLMRVSSTTFRRQLNPDDSDHPSDLHRAKRLLFAAFEHDLAKGEQVWAELDGIRARAHGVPKHTSIEFPGKSLFTVLERELNTRHIEAIPFTQRIAYLTDIISQLQSYVNGLRMVGAEDSPQGEGEGSDRTGRETVTTGPFSKAS